MNIASRQPQTKLRQTVSGLFYTLGTNGKPLIGIHWPRKAMLVEESNLSPVAGEWRDGEPKEAAMIRQVKAEYGFGPKLKIEITPIEHREFVSEANRKQYHWMLVHLLSESGRMHPQESEVASFGWYVPETLNQGISQMHAEKQKWFREVLSKAIHLKSDLIPFGKLFGRK